VVRLGERGVDYDPGFRLYMTCRLANPHYLPEAYIRVNLVDFTVTRQVRMCVMFFYGLHHSCCMPGVLRALCQPGGLHSDTAGACVCVVVDECRCSGMYLSLSVHLR
jgi:hypothetical protein